MCNGSVYPLHLNPGQLTLNSVGMESIRDLRKETSVDPLMLMEKRLNGNLYLSSSSTSTFSGFVALY